MDVSLAGVVGLGFAVGLRHALDADHVAAVAAMAHDPRGVRRMILNGVSWGSGHALAIAAAGGTALVLRATVPPRLALALDAAVAIMLVLLGAGALAGALRGRVHVHEHLHDGVAHAHLHFHAVRHDDLGRHAAVPDHHHPHPLRLAVRPFLVGGVHGLSGTAAQALLALTAMPTLAAGILYLATFGAGSIAGMALVSLALTAPLLIARRRAAWLARGFRALAGASSLGLGLLLGFELLRG